MRNRVIYVDVVRDGDWWWMLSRKDGGGWNRKPISKHKYVVDAVSWVKSWNESSQGKKRPVELGSPLKGFMCYTTGGERWLEPFGDHYFTGRVTGVKK
jgi:hypothetical protein